MGNLHKETPKCLSALEPTSLLAKCYTCQSVDKVWRLSGEIVTLYDCNSLPIGIYSSTGFGLF